MIQVLHFARLINRNDFIDTVIRFADPQRFRLMACTLTARANIEPPEYERAGIPHWVLDCPSRRLYALAVLRLARILRRERVDILHTHHYDETLIGVLAAGLVGLPVIIGRHYYDELYRSVAGAKLRALLAVERFCNRRARTIVVPSEPIRRLLTERQGVPAEKVRVISYGFDFGAERYRAPDWLEVEAARRELGVNGAFVIGNFARHHPLKGQEFLLQAFAGLARDFPGVRLLLVGDGPYHGTLRAMAKQLEVSDRVVFTGWRRDVSRLMGAVDAVVHPTLLEAFPQVMVEALALAKPLVITGVPGASEHIQDGRTGLLVPMQDSEALRKTLRWMIEHPDGARALGQHGHEYVRSELDIRTVVPHFEACYVAALARAT